MSVRLTLLTALAGLSTIALPIVGQGEPRLPKVNGGEFILDGSENIIIHKAPIGDPTTHQTLLNKIITAPANPILYIETVGGSIIQGMDIVNAVQQRGDVTCITPAAMSMGFAILQVCKTRVVSGLMPILLQHRPQVVLNGQKSLTELQSIINDFLIPMEKVMTRLQAKRLKLTEAEFSAKTHTDWTLVGAETILANNAADLHINIRCVGAANTKTRFINVQEPGMLFSTTTVQKTVRWCPVTDVPVEEKK
jgi:ATP-dependent protease ClpP protease subunit